MHTYIDYFTLLQSTVRTHKHKWCMHINRYACMYVCTLVHSLYTGVYLHEFTFPYIYGNHTYIRTQYYSVQIYIHVYMYIYTSVEVDMFHTDMHTYIHMNVRTTKYTCVHTCSYTIFGTYAPKCIYTKNYIKFVYVLMFIVCVSNYIFSLPKNNGFLKC